MGLPITDRQSPFEGGILLSGAAGERPFGLYRILAEVLRDTGVGGAALVGETVTGEFRCSASLGESASLWARFSIRPTDSLGSALPPDLLSPD